MVQTKDISAKKIVFQKDLVSITAVAVIIHHFFSMSSFFHDGVNEAFAESVSTSGSKFSLFCLQKVITDDLSNQEQK